MTRIRIIILILIFLCLASAAGAQLVASPIRTFGYFQNSFQHWTALDFETSHPQFSTPEERSAQNSFSLQQLNLFFQKDFARDWTVFVNFEILNSFSSSRDWGAFNLEEAWVRYRASRRLNLKFGLQIPVFNNLNEIKNRTPLLPYIIRPLVYETSFSEIFGGIEQNTPTRAFVQAYGSIPSGQVRLDYAWYAGNSPNINDQSERGQTGVDTTDTFLIGGRVGVRLKEFKIGISATRENVNLRQVITDVAQYEFIYNRVPRIRWGGDFSFLIGQLSFEGEFITVNYGDISEIRIDDAISEDASGDISIDGEFYYGTLGYQMSQNLFAYFSYSYLNNDFIQIASQIPRLVTRVGVLKMDLPTMGIACKLNDRITVKGQYVPVKIKEEAPGLRIMIEEKSKFNIFAIAVSVFF